MVSIQHLVGPAAISTVSSSVAVPPSSAAASSDGSSGHLSLLTYNVLLPNSVDGWWHYKMYLPPLDSEEKLTWSTWEYRRSLLRDRIATVNADVVCLQEVAPASFESDFQFMWTELGYDGREMFKKGRFRPATFWKSSKLELVSPPVHKDRTLLTAFRLIGATGSTMATVAEPTEQGRASSSRSSSSRIWYVLNCHLQAGQEGKRRVRQIHEGVRSALALARKLKDRNPERNIPLLVCGDLNGGDESGAVRMLEDGFVDETLREDGDVVASSRKALPLEKPLRDAAALVERTGTGTSDGDGGATAHLPIPATLVVPELISLLVQDDGKGSTAYENPTLSRDAKGRLERIFRRFATCGAPTSSSGATTRLVMGAPDAERWLLAINRALGRGSEFREAARRMGEKTGPSKKGQRSASGSDNGSDGDSDNGRDGRPPRLPARGSLSLQDFVEIYEAELRAGKFWGIAHDLAVLGEALPNAGVFESRYDRIYCSSSIRPIAVMDFPCKIPCPNRDEPSDHLPVAASFALVE